MSRPNPGLFARTNLPNNTCIRRLHKKLLTVISLMTLAAVLSASVPAQNNQLSPATAVNNFAFGQPVFAAGIWDFFSFLSFGSSAADDGKSKMQPSRPVNPSDENEKEKDAANYLPDPPSLAAAAPCIFNGNTITVAPGGSIQTAINAANPFGGDTISVSPGTYTEQLTVNKCVRIMRNGSTGTVTIQSPLTLTPSAVVGVSNTASIVEVRSNSYVEMSDLTITGPVPFTNSVSGIFVNENSTLKMTNAQITAIRPASGSNSDGNGYGIVAGSAAFNQIGFINLSNVAIDDYNKNGIVVARIGSDAQITKTSITGLGTQLNLAQNGIVIRNGATATITDNTIKNNICGAPGCAQFDFNSNFQLSYGVLLFSSGTAAISGNTFDNNDGGVYSWTPGFGSTVNNNTFTQIRYTGVDLDQGTHAVNNNFVDGSGFAGIRVLTYDGNTANSIANLQNNSITGKTQAGIELDKDATVNFFPTADASFNRIANNSKGIDNNTTTSTVSQTNNFWGCNQGPNGGTGCDTTDGLVNTSTPYLVNTNHTTAAISPVNAGGTSLITTNFRFNNLGTNTFTTANHLPNPIAPTASSANNPGGIPVTFTATNGTVNPTVTPLVDGLASTTFTGGTVDGGDQPGVITAKVDNATDSVTVTVLDNTAPTVGSSTGSLSSSNPSIVNFTVTFSEPVTGVGTTDFAAITTSGNVVSSVTGVSCTGAICTVQVTVASGMGSIRLDVLNDGTIKDTASAQNPLAAGSTGTPFNVDVQMPTVTSISRNTPTTQNTNASSVVFLVTFSEPVTGVDATDFTLAGTINKTAATIMVSTPDTGATRTVTVTGYTGDGTLGLNLVNNNSIKDADNNVLGNSLTGDTYNIDQTRPTVQITQAAGQLDPTTVSPINFKVVFSESVSGFTNSDVTVSGTAGAMTANVVVTPNTGVGTTFNVEVTPPMSGTVIISVGLNAATDAFNNGNAAFVPNSGSDNSVTYFTAASAMVVDDDGMAALNGTTPDCAATTAAPNMIQTAINLAASGGTIYVCPGTYVEELSVDKQLTLLGPKAGVNPNTGTRTDPSAEAVINPTTSDPDYFTGPIMVSLRARNITFNGFTLDGANPDPLVTSGVTFNGVDVDAAEGIDMPDNNFTGLSDPQETITNNIIKNIGDLGIALGANGSANSTNSTIQFNKIDNIPGVNYGGGVYVGNNAYTNITDNVITRISLGVVTENFYQPGLTGATIGNNQITANRIGIRHNLHYSYSSNGWMISNNTITSYVESSDPTATRFSGIRIESINGSVPATFSGNTINANRNVLLGNSPIAENLKGSSSVFYNKQENRRVAAPKVAAPNLDAAAAAYTRIDGIFLTNTSTISPNIVIMGNNITNALRGISDNVPAVISVNCNFIANNDVGIYVGHDLQYQNGNDPPSDSYATGGINISQNNIIGNTTYGVQNDQSTGNPPIPAGSMTIPQSNAMNNYWGAANGPGPIGSGSGDKVTTNVDFSNFLTSPSTCTPVSPPTVTINQASGQFDPTNTQPINFTVVFSEAVTGFTNSDVVLSGTAGNLAGATITVTGSGTTYNVAVSGLTTDGTVIANIPVAAAQSVATGSPTSASTSTDNTVTLDTLAPTVTINQAAGQADPTNASSINFTVVFSEPTTNFATGDVTLSGTAGATTATVTGSGTTYNVAVSGMTSSGTVIASIGAGVATDAAGNGNAASTSTDNTVTYDITAPTVTINQAAGQGDPTGTSPINFTVVFSEAVTGFATGDVTIATGVGTAFGVGSTPVAVVTGSGTTYNVAVSGMNQSGTVTATIGAGVAVDNVGNPNVASTSTDNTVTFNLVNTAVTVNPTNTNTAGVTMWGGFNDVTNALTPPSYVEGPALPNPLALGTGSARLNTTATGKYLFFSTFYNGTMLSQFTELSYSSYAIDPSNPANLPSLQIGIDYDSTDANTGFQGRIVFDPADNQTPPNQAPLQNTWQRYDATNGRFYFTQAPGNVACGISSPCSRATILATYPRINIPATGFGFIGFKSTGGGVNAVENYVDKFTVGKASANTTFNFEAQPPTISIGNAMVTEGNAGTTAATFTITQSVVSQLDTTVTVNTANGTATTADNDYQPIVNGTATILAGSMTTTVTVNVNGDTNVEGNETFTVNLSNAVNAAIVTATGTGTINNDDVVIRFCAATYNVNEGTAPPDPATTSATITVCRDGVTPNTVTVNYATSNGTATTPADYAATSGTLSFAPGDTIKSFTVPIVNDNISEAGDPETVNLTLSGVTGGAALGTAAAVLGINDDDGAGAVSISGNIKQFQNPGPNTNLQGVTVTLSGSASCSTTTSANGNYTFNAATPCTIPAGGSYQVTPSPDTPTMGKIFDPIYRNFTSLNVNVTNADFLAYNNLNQVPRRVRVGFAGAVPTQPVTVPIRLDALGNENTVSFSLSYNTARLSNPVVARGVNATGSTLFVNTSTPGVVGVNISMPTGQVFGSAGVKNIVTITFNTAATTDPNTPLAFVNSPTQTQVRDINANPLLSQFVGANVIYQQGIEGDADTDPVDGPYGDGDVDSGDVNLIGDYVVGNATPDITVSNQFQRADCEPTATKGDGDIDSGDVVQAGNYVVVDPLTAAGGPFASPAQMMARILSEPTQKLLTMPDSIPRVAQILNVNGTRGNTVNVPITLNAENGDRAIQFTLLYNQTILSSPQVSLGSGAMGASLSFNANVSGQIRVLINYASGSGFQAGEFPILNVQFTVNANAPSGITPITFSDSPTPRQVRDSSNTEVAANYTDGSVNVLRTTAAPVGISGRARNASGKGVFGAIVMLTDEQGNVRSARTDFSGRFAIADVPAGRTYILSVESRAYTFAPQVITVSQDLVGFDLILQPSQLSN